VVNVDNVLVIMNQVATGLRMPLGSSVAKYANSTIGIHDRITKPKKLQFGLGVELERILKVLYHTEQTSASHWSTGTLSARI
jgi:hypothetical protein